MDKRPGMEVLLVEDNPGDVRLLQELLKDERRFSLSLHHVDCLSEAAEFLTRRKVDLILLDLSLPDSQGLDTFRIIQEMAQSVAIIILTGLEDEDLATQAMQQGAQDYLQKGATEGELLLRSMRYAIERKRAELALRRARDTLELRVQERTAELAQINEELRNEIRERNRAEKALRASEERYRAVVEDQTELIFRLLPDGTLTFVNGAFCRFFQKNEGDILGRKPEEFFDEEEARQIYANLALLHGDNPVGKTLQWVSAGQDEPRWLHWTNRLIHDPLRGSVEYQCVGHDVTEEKKMEEALRESTRKLKIFAYSIIHDLKSPSVALHGLVRLLQKNYGHLLDERGAGYCEQILNASRQIGALVEAINLYIFTKETQPTAENVSLSQILQMIREEFSFRLEQRGVHWKVAEDLPQIRGDRLSLMRVFRNLVDNALKYGGKGLSSIRVEYASEPDFHILSVMDDGAGIDEEDSQRIFDLFERRVKVGEKGVEGTGLGLAIVREIAEKHGGRVWVETNPGGTTFNVSLSKRL